MSDSPGATEFRLPAAQEIAADITKLNRVQIVWSLSAPFFWIGLYFIFAIWGWWPFAFICLVCLSFVTYGSISHDLVHANLGLRRHANDFFLSLIELLALRSGHAYRLAHLHHHARFPHDDDIEGAAARMSLPRTLFEGVVFQIRIWCWAVAQARKGRSIIILEGIGCLLLIGLSILSIAWTPIFLVYVILMIMGSWIIPLVTSYLVHDVSGATELDQTRLYRGRVLRFISMEHLYHLEHHLYPSVPHHHWPQLAKRLDPYFAEAGLSAKKLWF